MSAMAKMLADMVLKELDPKIREALTPENMEKVVTGVVAKLKYFEDGMGALLAMQHETLELLKNVHGCSDDNGSGTRALEFGARGSAYGSEQRTGTDG